MPSVTSPVFLQFRAYYGTATNRRFGPTATSHDVRVAAALLLNADVAFLRAVLQATSE